MDLKFRSPADRIDEETKFSRTFSESDLKDIVQMYVDLAETLNGHEMRIKRLEDGPDNSWKPKKG